MEEGRNFLPVDADDTVDPVVFCNAFGKSKGTSVKKDIGSVSAVYWGEHVFIDIKNADNDVIMTEKLSIEVKDHRTLLKDNMVGTYVMDLASIYDSPEHTIKHQWLALFNPEWDKYDKVTGYIKVSVSLLHEDDKPIDLTVKDPNIIGEENLKIPPQLQPELTQLVVTLLDGQYLVKMDTHGTIDAYIEV